MRRGEGAHGDARAGGGVVVCGVAAQLTNVLRLPPPAAAARSIPHAERKGARSAVGCYLISVYDRL
jgi:hypothetical protein